MVALAASTLALWGQPTNPTVVASDEALRRQVKLVEMRARLAEASAALKQNEVTRAWKIYNEAYEGGKDLADGADLELRQVSEGISYTGLQLAQQAQRRLDLAEASNTVQRILVVDPKNTMALQVKKENERLMAESAGRMPSKEALAREADSVADRTRAGELIQDGRLLYELGQLKEAEGKLMEAAKLDPENHASIYYLDLVHNREFEQISRSREASSKKLLLEVERDWSRDILDRPALAEIPRARPDWPNAYAKHQDSNLYVNTSDRRQALFRKLRTLRLPELMYDNPLPLPEVFKTLGDLIRKADLEGKGINLVLGANADSPGDAGGAAPGAGAANLPPVGGEPVDLNAVQIKISPPVKDVTLEEALQIICMAADKRIKYSVEDYGIVFSFKAAETTPLHTRFFKVDPNTFYQGLQGVSSMMFGAQNSGGGGGGGGGGGSRGGGGGYGGGGRGGGGMGMGGMGGGMGMGGMGMGGMGGGMGGMGMMGMGGMATYAGVNIAGMGMGGMGMMGGGYGGMMGGMQQNRGRQGGGAQGGAQGGGGGGSVVGSGSGVRWLTSEMETTLLADTVRNFFSAAGVDLTTGTGKNIFFNDRLGVLMVRATLADLDTIEKAVQMLNMAPPQLNIRAKFLEITQNDNRALGFDWYLGNWMMGPGNSIGTQAGTAPTFISPLNPTAANPSGVFPGPGIAPGIPGPYAVSPAPTDNQLTSGLRNGAPTLATMTGILTDPQFRVAIRALEQRDGVDLIASPEVTTQSGRQAQIKAVEVQYIVTDMEVDQTGSSGVGGAGVVSGGAGGVASTILPTTEAIEIGPILDVIPVVTADGFTVQMTLIPTLKEFLGYDSQTQFNVIVQSVSTSSTGTPIIQPTPLPRFRLRQVVTSVSVWDGQTVVLGGLIAEQVSKQKDSVPFLGDLPLIGRLFRSESNESKKKNLVIFVTPTIIDPAGNPLHSPDEMPYVTANNAGLGNAGGAAARSSASTAAGGGATQPTAATAPVSAAAPRAAGQ